MVAGPLGVAVWLPWGSSSSAPAAPPAVGSPGSPVGSVVREVDAGHDLDGSKVCARKVFDDMPVREPSSPAHPPPVGCSAGVEGSVLAGAVDEGHELEYLRGVPSIGGGKVFEFLPKKDPLIAGGPGKDLLQRAFVDVVRGSGPALLGPVGGSHLAGAAPLPSNFYKFLEGYDGLEIKSHSLKDGIPAICLSESEMALLAKPMKFSLVGKFSAGRPKWIEVEKFFGSLKLRGDFKIANLNARHFFIHLQLAEDYIRVFSKKILYINGFRLTLLKWSSEFSVESEPSICPVWISFLFMRLHLYTPELLFSIASIFGRPLRTDFATSNWSRPSLARILVEMDVTVQHSDKVWIGSESGGYHQEVIFEHRPSYCMHCRKIGHSKENYFILNPELRKENVQIPTSEMQDVGPVVGEDVGNQVSDGPVRTDDIGSTHLDPLGDSCPADVPGPNNINVASTAKRFTRSSLKGMDGQQVVFQRHGNESKMEKVIDIIDRVLDDSVRLEEVRCLRESAGKLKEKEKKKREENKVAAAARFQAKSKKSQGKGKRKKK